MCCYEGQNITTNHDQAGTATSEPVSDAPLPKPKLTKSQGNRMNQTARAMLYSVLATLALLIGFLALNPSADREFDPGIDVAAAAAEVDTIAAFTPAIIDAPDTWRANYARWNSGATDDVPAWNVGYLTEDEEFLGISQTANASNAWIRAKVDPVTEPTQVTVGGHPVERYVGRDEHLYLVAAFDQPQDANAELPSDAIEPTDTMTLIISGSMDEESFNELASQVITQYR